ncbi:MAG TPA: cupin domain-containing protein [Lysobacter sp.]
MKRSIVLAACLCAVAVPLSGVAQDMAVTAGKDAKVLLDNEKVRVLEVQLAPGASTGMHSHGDNIVYYVTGGDALQTMADGTTKQRHTKPGEILWSEPVTHDSKNVGKAPTKVLVIELKEPGK